ncbi:DeoR/GlpR family DNA-binding transcription regulator [Vogesella amnigena]|uniref:DeoR/GlpR family DNA-binding transcription regulator n=1 Tax=Vogesella amnigena TaxID=1507449 RepID=A0ABV7TRG5_9NEIS
MWQEERYQRIRGLLHSLQRVSTERIVAELGVSRETVRRDLVAMEKLGLLKRTHGGAICIGDEAPIAERAQQNVAAKRAIARAALAELTHGQTVFVDAGTTTAILAEELARFGGLTVITNSFDVALTLRDAADSQLPPNRVVVLGGTLGARAPSTLGADTVAEICRYRADVALISPVGVEAGRGASNYDHQEAAVARAMVDNAARLVLLADSSKLGVGSRVVFCTPQRIDVLITERSAKPLPALEALATGVGRIVLAG